MINFEVVSHNDNSVKAELVVTPYGLRLFLNGVHHLTIESGGRLLPMIVPCNDQIKGIKYDNGRIKIWGSGGEN